jgi:hypothetical protein
MLRHSLLEHHETRLYLRPRLKIWVALLALLLGGCSTVRLVYNQADTVLAWTANDYFDLDATQKQAFNARLTQLLAWHRGAQLPDYARVLTDVQSRMQRTFTRQDAEWLIDAVKARYRAMTSRATPDIVDLLFTLTPDNIKALERQFSRDNQKFAREHKLHGSPDEQRRERLERTVKRIREWTGPLTPAQLERVSALNDAIPNADAMRLQDRQRRQKEFLILLATREKAGATKIEFARALNAWFADWESARPPELKSALNESAEKRITLYLEAERMLSPEQRLHVHAKLQGYIEDIKALAAHGLAR